MKTLKRLAPCVVAAFMLTSCATSETTSDADHDEHAEGAHWGYEVDNGPAEWGEMDPDWILCAEGLQQSPIDLANATEMSLPTSALHLPSDQEVSVLNQEGAIGALNNGHTIQVNAATGETLTVGEDTYALVQFHFHAPSEHTVNGKHFPMEMHFVHASEDGRLAVVGVLIEEGEENRGIATLWNQLAEEKGTQATVQLDARFADAIFPTKSAWYFYDGSLTTPPCSEGVKWFVRKDPIQFSAEQFADFTAVYDHNNRPVQPPHGRALRIDSDPDVTIN